MNQRVYIGMGSNLGNRMEHLRWVVRRLQEHTATAVKKVSPVYTSAAHTLDGNPQPAYLNAVVEITTTRDVVQLLALLHTFEHEAGRNRQQEGRWGSRTLDLDILAFGDVSIRSAELTVPHRRLADRRFVLAPWCDIAPTFGVPAPFGCTVAELLACCTDKAELAKTSKQLLD